MEFAENLALDHKFDNDLGHALKESPNNGGFHYFNTKKINVVDDDDDEEIPSNFSHFKYLCSSPYRQLELHRQGYGSE